MTTRAQRPAAPQRLRFLAVALAATLASSWLTTGAAAVAGPGSPDDAKSARSEIVVKFRSEGPFALQECAEALSARGDRFRDHTADRSDSLDRLRDRLSVGRMRSVFRRPDARRGFAQQREALRRRLENRRARRRGAPNEAVPDLAHVYRVELGEGVDVATAVARFGDDPHVEYAQPDYEVTAQLVPDDPYYHTAGSWGQAEPDLWGLLRLGMEAVWDLSRGEGVVVAVTDTGLDYDHPDIAANVWVNPGEDLDGNGVVDDSDWNGIDDDDNGYVDDLRGFDFANSVDLDRDGRFDGPFDVSDPDPFDDHGHGTHVSGTIAAVANNGIGIAGVAPDARIMALKGLGEFGSGPISQLAAAIVYAAEQGADVINNSWSCSERCPSNPVAEDAIRVAHALGVVQVFSAGNKSDDIVHYSPQNMHETIAVGATTPADQPTAFTSGGTLMDVVAPGGGSPIGSLPFHSSNILSLRSSGTRGPVEAFGGLRVGNEYLRLAGTSMSAPHVSGVAALLRARYPDLDAEDVRRVLRQTADDLGAAGHDAATGAGLVNPLRALQKGLSVDLQANISAPRPGVVVHRAEGVLEIRGTAAGPDFDHYQLFFGRGREPSLYREVDEPRFEAVEDGVLGSWDVANRANGSIVLLLRVTSSSGETFEEFAPVSLELIDPIRISPPGPDAQTPAVDGNSVVWTSDRVTGVPPEPSENRGPNLFLTDLARLVDPGDPALTMGDDDGQYTVSLAPGSQTRPGIAGNVISWFDDRFDPEPALMACAWRGGPWCDEQTVVPSAARPRYQAISKRWIAWTDLTNGTPDLFVCKWLPDIGACGDRIPITPDSDAWDRFDLDGDRLAWNPDAIASVISTCALDDDGGCEPTALVHDATPPRWSPVVSGELFAWQSNYYDSDLYVCQRDPATGACPPILVERDIEDPRHRVSNGRLTWQSQRRDDDLDVFYCELDPVLQRCPIQRVTGSAALQHNPDISKRWLVWEDSRDGASAIFGVGLPDLLPIGDRTVDEGRKLRIWLEGVDPADQPGPLSARLLGGELEDLGAELTEFAPGHGLFEWRPGYDQAGQYVITFAFTNASGLESQETIRLEVHDVNRPPRAVAPPLVWAATGSEIVLDGCASHDPDGDPMTITWRDAWGRTAGTDCALPVRSPRWPRVEFYALDVDDGALHDVAPVWILWLPGRWLDLKD